MHPLSRPPATPVPNREASSCARDIPALLPGGSLLAPVQDADAGAMARDAVRYARAPLSRPAQPCRITY